MQQPPIGQAEIDARIGGHEDELLLLWQAEQGGPAKDRDLQIISSSLPFPRDRQLRVLDLCCGPGDLGRAIRQHYPAAQVDFADRDPLLLAVCRGVNGRAGVPGSCRQLDLGEPSWCQDLPEGRFDVIAVACALHWLTRTRAAAVLRDVYRLLDDDGALFFAEPVVPQAPFAPGFSQWKAQQPPRYEQARWTAFWRRASELAGYDHTQLLGPREADRLGDGMTVHDWTSLTGAAGFRVADVLWRDADGVIIAARKAGTGPGRRERRQP